MEFDSSHKNCLQLMCSHFISAVCRSHSCLLSMRRSIVLAKEGLPDCCCCLFCTLIQQINSEDPVSSNTLRIKQIHTERNNYVCTLLKLGDTNDVTLVLVSPPDNCEASNNLPFSNVAAYKHNAAIYMMLT